jgi:hypothetical protein
LNDQFLTFTPVVAGMRGATEMAAEIVPAARELDDLFAVIATEIANAIDGLLGDLDQRIEALRGGHAALELPPALLGSHELPQENDRVLHLPEWLPRKKPTKEESVEEGSSTVAA